MDILHASTELAPVAKVGGLADVVSALTKHLKLLGHRVTLVMPRLKAFEGGPILLARRLTPLTFEHGGKTHDVVVYDGKLASGVELVLVDAPPPDRAGIYGDAGVDYPDNPERFALFSRAVVELAMQRAESGTPFSIAHAHDWPTALVPYFFKQLEKAGRTVPKTVLTLHNLAHQGIVPRDKLPSLGVSWDDFHMNGVEFFGQGNLLKAGIVSADALTTVSDTYARDILTPGGGARLEGVLGSRRDALTGIVNGVDASVWNPATDVALAARYDVEDITNKARCKGALLAELGLEVAAERPLAVFVGRLADQKGADLLAAALPKILAAEVAVAIAGDGSDEIAARLDAIAQRHHGRVAFVRAAPEALVHRLFSGADIAMVPSRFEPCGLVQLYAQRYGTLPVAHATGGIKDTVVDCDASLETGTGFLFDEPTAEALAGAVARARTAYESPRWRALVRRVMRLDRSWERPARRFEQIYKKLAP
jgi:starch synthase